jgi:hypothetical protein
MKWSSIQPIEPGTYLFKRSTSLEEFVEIFEHEKRSKGLCVDKHFTPPLDHYNPGEIDHKRRMKEAIPLSNGWHQGHWIGPLKIKPGNRITDRSRRQLLDVLFEEGKKKGKKR